MSGLRRSAVALCLFQHRFIMRFRALKTPLSAPSVGEACVRRRVKNSACRACADVCPTSAINITGQGATLDESRCVACGYCLFTCPADAIESLPTPLRCYRQALLIAPSGLTAPCKEELLMWHACHGIRGVAAERELPELWLRAVAALNLTLDKLRQPRWRLVYDDVARPGAFLRHRLALQQKRARRGRVPGGVRARRAAFAFISEFTLQLSSAKCLLCGACARVCPEKAIMFHHAEMVLEHAKCTGCGSCEAVCPTQALHVVKGECEGATAFAIITISCSGCRQPAQVWRQEQTQCPVCARHTFGMRES